METVTNQDEYEQFLEDVVEGRNNNDRSSFEHVAQVVTTSFRNVDDEMACLVSCEPYTTSWYTIDPSTILRFTTRDFDAEEARKHLRQVAVDVLSKDLEAFEKHSCYDFEYNLTNNGSERITYRGLTLGFENIGLMTRVSVMGTAEGLTEFAEERINRISPYYGEGSEIKTHASEEGRGLVTTEYVEIDDKLPVGILMEDLLDWAFEEHAYHANCWVAESDYGAHVVFTIVE